MLSIRFFVTIGRGEKIKKRFAIGVFVLIVSIIGTLIFLRINPIFEDFKRMEIFYRVREKTYPLFSPNFLQFQTTLPRLITLY